MFANATERYLTSSDGTQIYALAAGNSHLPSLVFIHGLALSSLVFAQLFRNKDLLKLFYLVAYDMRGHGRTGKPNTLAGHASSLYADDFAAVVQGFNLTSPILAGWSLGATVAADVLTHLAPQSISGIIQTAPVPYIGPIVAEIAKPYIREVLLPGLVSTSNVSLALSSRVAFIDALFNDPSNVPIDVKWSWLGSSAVQSPSDAQFVVSREQDPTKLLEAGSKGLPLLMVNGGADQNMRGDLAAEAMSRNFTNMEVFTIPDGSHAIFYEFEAEYVGEVIKFAKRVFATRKQD